MSAKAFSSAWVKKLLGVVVVCVFISTGAVQPSSAAPVSPIPEFTSPDLGAPFGSFPYIDSGESGKSVTITASTNCAPYVCGFDAGISGQLTLDSAPSTPISFSVTRDSTTPDTLASFTLPAHVLTNKLQVESGTATLSNSNGSVAIFQVHYYAAPGVAFGTGTTSGSPVLLSTGAAMTPITLTHTSGYCTNLTTGTSAIAAVPGLNFTWDSTTQSGSVSGTPTSDMGSTPGSFTVTCSNPGGADSSATIYIQSNKLPQTVGSLTLAGAGTPAAGVYTIPYGTTGVTFSYTTSPVSGGGAVTLTPSDATCLAIDNVAKTISVTCVPNSDVILTAVAASTATYNQSAGTSVTLRVQKANQTIPTFTVGGAGGTAPNYTAGFGDALTYAFTTNPVSGGGTVSVTSSDACVTVDQLAKTLAITCVPVSAITLTATAASNTNYNGPVTKTATLTVSKGQLHVAFTPILFMIAGGATQDLSINSALTPVGTGIPTAIQYTVAAGSSSVCSLSGHILTAIASGNCLVTATAVGNTNMLDAAPVTATIVVQSAASQILTFSGLAASYNYGAADVTFHVTDLFGDTLQVSSIYTNTATVTQTGPTTWVMHILQPGNALISAYDPTTKVTKQVTVAIAPKPVTLLPFMATVSSTGSVTFDPATVTGVLPGDYVTVDASQVVGSYGSTGQLTWTGLFKLAGSSAQNYVIAAQPLTIAVHPAAFGLTPAFGSPVGGNIVTITGAGFTPSSLVSFGTSVATKVTYLNSSTLQVVTPAHAIGTVPVVIAIPGVGAVNSPTSFEYKPMAPVISSVTPGSSTTTGGTVIEVRGENFTNEIVVSLDGVAIGVQSVTANSVRFSTPAHAAGAVKLTLTNPGLPSVTWTSDLLYILPISVTPVAVTKAWTSGGAKVSVSGDNFASGIKVTVAGVSATDVLVVDPRTLTFSLPAVANAGAADIVITTAEGQVVTLPASVLFMAAPSLKLSFGKALVLTRKQLASVKKFATVVKRAGLKLKSVSLAAYSASATPTKAEIGAAKARIQAIKAAMAALGLKPKVVLSVSGASGSLKNTVLISGS